MFRASVMWLLACLFAFLALAAPACAHAAGLVLDASCPEDGASGVPTSGRLWVRYDHNIAAVADNAKLAHLTDDAGKDVPKSVCKPALPDFQTEFGYRQYLFFDVDGLGAGTTYHLKVDAGVQAKNGSVCEDAVDIAFTTAKKSEKAIELEEPTENEGGSGDGSGGGDGNGSAFANGDIELVDWVIANSANPDEPRPTEMPSTMAHYAVLTFSKGIDYFPPQEGVDLSHLEENYAKVSLQKLDGTKVEGVKIYSLDSRSEDRHGNIYVDLEERLEPLSEYRIVVEPGITTYSGVHTSAERYEISFRTNGDLGGGLTVAHVLVAAVVLVAVCVGIAVQIRRRVREKGSPHG